jgi:hypothetical protein
MGYVVISVTNLPQNRLVSDHRTWQDIYTLEDMVVTPTFSVLAAVILVATFLNLYFRVNCIHASLLWVVFILFLTLVKRRSNSLTFGIFTGKRSLSRNMFFFPTV